MFAFLALPGVIAFVVPYLLRPSDGYDARSWTLGAVPLGAGIVLLLWCVRDFYRRGKGTLAPWSPPRELVVAGAYRFSRNPMYIAVALVLCGWSIGFRSGSIALYTAAVIVAFHLRVVFGEEPWLARTHGDKWERYKARVPRWFGRPSQS